jgi:hypothetical protein
MRRRSFLAVLLVLGLPAPARSQDPRDLPVRTFRLQNLSAADAAKLLAPYVNAPNGGVFEAGSINAITVRETHSMLAVVDSLLRTHDRPRAVVTMRFQVIAALDSNYRDPAIAGIDAELRKLFRFSGYELIGEGTARTEERSEYAMTLSTKPKVMFNNERITEALTLARCGSTWRCRTRCAARTRPTSFAPVSRCQPAKASSWAARGRSYRSVGGPR